MDVIRDRSVMARQVDRGAVENVYTLQLMNASDDTKTVSINVLPADFLGLIRPVTAKLAPSPGQNPHSDRPYARHSSHATHW